MEGRSLWIQDGDVDGTVEVGRVVTATRPLADFCLRGDDGTEPVAAGTLLEVVELRPWGAAMAQEIDLHVENDAAGLIEQLSLWDYGVKAVWS